MIYVLFVTAYSSRPSKPTEGGDHYAAHTDVKIERYRYDKIKFSLSFFLSLIHI